MIGKIKMFFLTVWEWIKFSFKVTFMKFKDVPKGFMWLKILNWIILLVIASFAFYIIALLVVITVAMVGLLGSIMGSAEQATRDSVNHRRNRGPFM